jgi:ferritin-like metal-binding protein YciE
VAVVDSSVRCSKPDEETAMTTSQRSTGKSERERAAPDGAELLALELQQIQSAESQLSSVLPSLAEAVESEQLRELLELREKQGERILGELAAAFGELEEDPPKKKNVAAEGLIEAAQEHIRELEEGPALDAALIAGIQKVEHYCIAAWGTARSLAEATGHKTTVLAMEQELKDGRSLDEKLTELAEKEITPALLSEGVEDEGSEDEEVGEQEGKQAGRKGGGSGSRRQEPRH